ncbi:MAG: hypothetical protein ACRD5Z_23995 [Bryobacteraceae bacterium]
MSKGLSSGVVRPMPQLFRPVADTIARVFLVGILAAPFIATAAG